MSAFKPQQRHLTIGGRTFHFVAYEPTPGNVRRGEAPGPALWCLMVEGRRMPAIPWTATQTPEAVDSALAAWVAEHVPPVPVVAPAARPATPKPARRVVGDWAP